MRRRFLELGVLISLAAPAAAAGGTEAWGVAIQGATVNPDHSVTITWHRETPDVSVTSITVDYVAVSASSASSGQRFTTAPLLAGSHTITIEVVETFRSDTYLGGCVA